ncbi:MAG: hypothetical protein Q8K07_10645, partial [Methylicorpusculum sp.]|nr:hypothetical protein [Methylicorpusculum sp.]
MLIRVVGVISTGEGSSFVQNYNVLSWLKNTKLNFSVVCIPFALQISTVPKEATGCSAKALPAWM